MRKQYYFRPSERGILAWDVDRLVELAKALPRSRVALSTIRELDEPFVGDDERPTWRAMLEHMILIQDADLSYPIILSSRGEVMDGRHRIAKAALQKESSILAVRFVADPEPDYVGRGPDDLSYDP
jgi:hypothetical protein